MGIKTDRLCDQLAIKFIRHLNCGICKDLVEDVKQLKGCQHLFCKLRVK